MSEFVMKWAAKDAGLQTRMIEKSKMIDHNIDGLYQGCRIVIADDHPLLLKGLKDYLVDHDMEVIAAVCDGERAMQVILDEQPDVAILDVEMPGMTGLEVASRCHQLGLNTKVIILTSHKNPVYAAKADELNIRAYLLKEEALSNIKPCIASVLGGHQFFSSSLSKSDITDQREKLSALATLTPSEKKILNYIAQRNTSKDIADLLHISLRTVEKHRSNISGKLQLEGKAHDLSAWALENATLLDVYPKVM